MGFIVLVVLVGLFVLAYSLIQANRDKPVQMDPTESKEYKELQLVLFNIKELAETHRDAYPLFSDVVLSEIRNHERKELGPHA